MSKNTYYNNLISGVIDLSESATWERAVLEWDIVDCEEDEFLESSCVCGKENLRYLFTIENRENGNELFPIGSSCIKKFERSDLSDEASVREQLFRLLHAIENNDFIILSSEFFSRRLLGFLYEADAFDANEYNGYDPEVDYEFLLKMFNKRDKDTISPAQNRKISAIILGSLKPYLKDLLRDKIRH
jgi:hypothetical protein